MALDMAILEETVRRDAVPTLRFYGWAPPCLTLGRHQPLEAADLGFCRKAGIEVARRPTGGRAVLHHMELTYAVIAPLGVPPLPSHVQDAYRTVCRPLVEACRSLGVSAEMTPGEINLSFPGPRSTVPCFKAPAGGEIVAGGRKLIGSAMRVHRGHILQHGALLLDWDGSLQAGAMGLATDATLRPHITTLSEELGESPPLDHVQRAVVQAFETILGLELTPGDWTTDELRRADELHPTFAIAPVR